MSDNASRLKAWRALRGLSQDAAAKLIGAKQRTWARWELGGAPDIAHAVQLEELTEGDVPLLGWARRKSRKAA